ncbi:14304_t:CDS:2 [Acaulospora morrowiae]|uniref:14304_t:CDS:1 n=1 Tax=Acaulospora morrowiae TaxID=94023 RepID=A0A9N8ZS07_9GLOM|nr:14304_t:CDS:2 [Acaulospora morrowiae]
MEMKRLEISEDSPLTPQCMQGITLVHCGRRVFRVPTASIASAITSEQKMAALAVNDGSAKQKEAKGAKQEVKEVKKEVKERKKEVKEMRKEVKEMKKEVKEIEKEVKNERTETSTLEIKLKCPISIFGQIIGKGGAKIKQLQRETKTRIVLDNRSESISIKGSKADVEMAKTRLEEEIDNYLPPTHFISLPLSDSQVHQKVNTFQTDVMSLSLPNIETSIMIKPTSLHLTIGMLNLHRQNDLENAIKLLKDLGPELHDLVGTKTMVIKLSGVAVMEDDPKKTNVLYAKVEEQEDQNILFRLSEFLITKFTEAGYLKKDNRPLKPHATIINVRHRGETDTKENERSNQRPRWLTFSAIPILEKFSNFEFGTCRIESVHIAKVGTYDENGRHRCEVSVKLP